ncbi:MAG: hypothetical protein OEY93_08615 [Anaerolineae bacterium]|nr:hypothetical protein [Anaerolineae bacterium]
MPAESKHDWPPKRKLKRIGMIARWRPVHLGQTPVLRGLCERAEEALIGIGSANRYNLRNPFTLQETIEMIDITLAGYRNYTLLPVPDLDDGPRWREMVLDIFGELDLFLTANPYVASLLDQDYNIAHPVSLVLQEDRIPLEGTMVRKAMAQGDAWQEMVSPEIAAYISANQLDERFRREFGLEALAVDTIIERKK